MYDKAIVGKTEEYVKDTLDGDGSGHDWWHIHRVLNLARTIQKKEGGDLYIVELSSLLHDIADWKYCGGDDTLGPKKAREFLETHSVSDEICTYVCDIISTISFKGAGVPTPMATLEGEIVQDADRLDALGAIGIARTFAYGGHKGQLMHHPDIRPVMHQTSEEYKSKVCTVVNHFYEKLLLLKDRMNTETGRNMAEVRHAVMEQFLDNFYDEWAGIQ